VGVSIRTPDIDEAIIAGIAEGIPLAEICRRDGMPHRSSVYDWIEEDEEFARRIARARQLGFDAIAEDGLKIVDDLTEDPASRRVRADYRLKLLAKWDPKRYGDRVGHEHSGPGGGPIDTKVEATIRFVRPGEAQSED
jgi:hypothetical protein